MLSSTYEKKYLNKQRFSLLIIGLFLTIIVDISFVKIYDIINKDFITLEQKMIVLTLNSFICLLFQIGLLKYIHHLFKQERFQNIKKIFEKNYKISLFSIAILFGLTFLMIIQQFYNESYNKFIVISIVSFSYSIACFFLLKLILLFVSWLRYSKRTLVLLYFISMSLIMTNMIFAMTITILKLNDKPDDIRNYFGGSTNFKFNKYDVIDLFYNLTSILAFISLWTTTFILVTNYRNKSLKNIFFLILLFMPLIYFIGNYFLKLFANSFFYSFSNINPILLSIFLIIVFSLSKPIGGITFGILFWRTSKAISYEKDISGFILIAGYGIILIFCSNQATTFATTPFPSFGIVTITTLNMASYLMLIGIYNSAKLVSINNELRKSIYKITLESRILNIIGEAEKEKALETIVWKVHQDKNIFAEKENIKQTTDLDNNELKKYVEEILQELKNKRK